MAGARIVNNFKNVKTEAEVLAELFDWLNTRYQECFEEWGVVDTDPNEQAQDWRGTLLWEDDDHTIPKPKPIYGTITKDFNELDVSEQDRAVAIKSVADKINKMYKF